MKDAEDEYLEEVVEEVTPKDIEDIEAAIEHITLHEKEELEEVKEEIAEYKEVRREYAGPRSAVGNMSGYRCLSDCRSRGREFHPGPIPYFRGD